MGKVISTGKGAKTPKGGKGTDKGNPKGAAGEKKSY